jgi:hypothetical protein
MYTLNFPPTLATTLSMADEIPIKMVDELIVPIVKGESRRDINKALKETIFDYLAFKTMFIIPFMEEILQDKGNPEELIRRSNGVYLQVLSDSPHLELSALDKKVILRALRAQFVINHLLDEARESDKPFAAAGIFDGLLGIQGIDLCLVSILYIAKGLAEPASPKGLHWLCLAMNWYIDRFLASVLVNDPELVERLKVAAEIISNERMEKKDFELDD